MVISYRQERAESKKMKYDQMQSATNSRKKAAAIFVPFINFLKQITSSGM